MRKSPQKEAAERKAAAKHEADVQKAQRHIRTLMQTMLSGDLDAKEGNASRALLMDEIKRLVREDEIYNEAAAEQFLVICRDSLEREFVGGVVTRWHQQQES